MSRKLLRSSRFPLVLAGALLSGVAAARLSLRTAARRSRIERGELRELSEMWTWSGGRCWYARLGSDKRRAAHPPIVLVHGFGISSAYFVPAAERLAAFYDVYAPDLPGHGKTDSPAEPLDVAGFAEALAGWLDSMQLRSVRLIGHSMGCQTAVELALRRRDLVDRLVLIGPTIDRRSRTLRETLPRFLIGGVREPPTMTLLLARDYLRARRALPTELRAMFAYEIEEALPRIGGVPLLLVRGEHDAMATAEWLEQLAQLVPSAQVAVVLGGAHAVHYTKPEALVDVLRPFLDAAEEPLGNG